MNKKAKLKKNFFYLLHDLIRIQGLHTQEVPLVQEFHFYKNSKDFLNEYRQQLRPGHSWRQ
jgi:hypothetical protein